MRPTDRYLVDKMYTLYVKDDKDTTYIICIYMN